jgi:DNA gyrase subunit A
VIGAGIARPKTHLLVITEQGFGKLTPIDDYPKQHRAGGGVRTFKIIEKTGGIADARLVTRSQEVMFISANGIVVRTPVKDITVQGRSTQGVILMRMNEGDEVVALAHMDVD